MSNLQDEPCDICGDIGVVDVIATCSQCKIAREHVYDLSLSLSIFLLLRVCLCVDSCMCMFQPVESFGELFYLTGKLCIPLALFFLVLNCFHHLFLLKTSYQRKRYAICSKWYKKYFCEVWDLGRFRWFDFFNTVASQFDKLMLWEKTLFSEVCSK